MDDKTYGFCIEVTDGKKDKYLQLRDTTDIRNRIYLSDEMNNIDDVLSALDSLCTKYYHLGMTEVFKDLNRTYHSLKVINDMDKVYNKSEKK